MDKTERGQKARNDGYAGETAAVWFLRAKGYRILERNFKPPRGSGAGELDIVALKKDTLVFVEVKRRKTNEDAAYSISETVKRRRIRGAEYFLMTRPEYANAPMRFDAILLAAGKLPQHVENAWEC